MNLLTFIGSWLIVLVSLLWISTIQAKESIGRVVKRKGLVYKRFRPDQNVKRLWTGETYMKRVADKDETQGVHLDSDIFAGDTIITEEASFVQMELNDKTILTLGPKGQMTVQSFMMNNPEAREGIFSHAQGILKMRVPRPIKQGNYQLHLPHISMGIRGTTLMTQISNSDQEHIALLEGLLDVYHRDQIYNMKGGDVLQYDDYDQVPNVMNVSEKLLPLSMTEDLHEVNLARLQAGSNHHLKIIPKAPASETTPPNRKKSWQEILLENQNAP